MKTYLEIVKQCDNFPYSDIGSSEAYDQQMASLWKFYLPNNPRPHGFLLNSVASRMPWIPFFHLIPQKREIHLLPPSLTPESLANNCNAVIDGLLDIARSQGVFSRLGKKRDENFPIIGSNLPISIERSASSLFGIIGRGVHMTVYVSPSSGPKFWIPQLNLKKSTWAGMLDNTIAGGMAVSETPLECLIRESEEEAGLDAEMVREKARPVGTVSYFNISDENAGGELGLMNPGLLYVYDLEVGEDVVFESVDGDVEGFKLMGVKEVREEMGRGRFKYASACVLIDFFVRHGIITAENEWDYVEIVERLHRRLPFPTRPGA